MQFDVVSDLHVESWKYYPYDWENEKKSDVVVIAGDIADDVDTVVRELKKACDVYKHVLYIDGNHESMKYMHLDLEYANALIDCSMTGYTNFHNLYNRTFVYNNIAFIGACGWWDFRCLQPRIPAYVAKQNIQYADRIERMAFKQHTILSERIQRIDDDDNINGIVVVTHTVPHRFVMSTKYPADVSMQVNYGNTQMERLTSSKLKCFIYGHSHDSNMIKHNGVLYVNNARGRPSDFNRVVYSPRVVSCY